MAQTVSSRIHSLGPAWGLRILPDCTKARPPGRSTRAHEPRVSGEVPVQMDGVGGGEDVRLACEQLRPHHLLEELEPPLLLEPAQEPEADALLAAELVEGDAEELGGAVHDQRPDLAVEDSQIEPIEEDAGPARVVDEELAVLEVARQVLHRRIEVAVPAVVLDGVVPEAEGVHGLLDPVLVGDAGKTGGPLEPPPRPARLLDGGADGGVDAQKVGDGGGRPPAPAALGGDPELGHEAVGHLDAAARALDAVGVVEQAQVELGLGAQAEIAAAAHSTPRRARSRGTGRWIQLSGRPRLAASALAISTSLPASAGSLKWRCWTSP